MTCALVIFHDFIVCVGKRPTAYQPTAYQGGVEGETEGEEEVSLAGVRGLRGVQVGEGQVGATGVTGRAGAGVGGGPVGAKAVAERAAAEREAGAGWAPGPRLHR